MVSLADLKGAVLLMTLIALIAGATAIALGEFQNSSAVVENSTAYNITNNGLEGIYNSTSFLSTIGTIIGVMVLVGIVVTAFAFGQQ